MKLKKPLKEKDNMHLFTLYNNECSSSDNFNCNQTNAVAACGGTGGNNLVSCGLLKLFSCKK